MPRATSSTAFKSMQGVTCEKGEVTFVIDVSEFADADSAYGMFCGESRPAAADQPGSAPAGRFVPRRATFRKRKVLSGDRRQSRGRPFGGAAAMDGGARKDRRGQHRASGGADAGFRWRNSSRCGWFRKACSASAL